MSAREKERERRDGDKKKGEGEREKREGVRLGRKETEEYRSERREKKREVGRQKKRGGRQEEGDQLHAAGRTWTSLGRDLGMSMGRLVEVSLNECQFFFWVALLQEFHLLREQESPCFAHFATVFKT